MVKTLWLFCLGLTALLASCGGGGGNGEPQPQSLSVQESQRYFPLNDGNLWVSKETDSTNGSVTESYTWVTRSAGTKLVGNVVTSVIAETNIADGTVSESYLLNNDTGITDYGSNSPSDTLTAAVNPYPYRRVNFPIQVGATIKQFDKTGLDYGRDFDGDGRNELVDVSSSGVVSGFETVSTAAGTFQNCLRVDTNATVTIILSTNGNKITINGADTDWYAQDIGPVKHTTIITANGISTQTNEELTGYMVNGRSNGLSLKVGSSSATVGSGASTQLNVMILDSTNSPVFSVPGTWTSDNIAIATVDANGLATGVATGTAMLTSLVGGVTGPSVTLNVMAGFRSAIKYPSPISGASFGDTAIGDLNGDGRNDVAVLSGSRIMVYEQNSSGSLTSARVITTNLNLRGIAIKDVNNDGLADLVVSGDSRTSMLGWFSRVQVFKQDPATHTLGPPQEYAISTNNAGPPAVADLNGDGLSDVVVASGGIGGNGQISFLFQGPNGILGPEVAYSAAPIYNYAEVHVADMNSDSLNDVVVQSGPKQLAVIKQVSPGIFSSAPDLYTVQTNYWPSFESFALGDLNGDGHTDIAVADLTGNLNLFLQNANGTLSPPQFLNFPASELKIFDIDGDGLNDLLLLESGTTVKILKQSVTHLFQDAQTFSLPTLSSGGTFIHQAMSVGDVTGDGLPDIVASWSVEGVFVLPRR